MMEGPRGDILIILHRPDDCKGLSTRLGGSLGPSCASACRGRMSNRPLAGIDLGSSPDRHSRSRAPATNAMRPCRVATCQRSALTRESLWVPPIGRPYPETDYLEGRRAIPAYYPQGHLGVEQPVPRGSLASARPIGRRRFLFKAGALGATLSLGAVGLAACGGTAVEEEPTAKATPKRTTTSRTVAAASTSKATQAAVGHGATKEAAAGHGDAAEAVAITPDAALAALMAGNARFVAMKLKHPDTTIARRTEVATGQHPFACVIGCIDSRVPPELVFDQGLGNLLISRVGGAIADDSIIGSTEFGVEEFHIPVVMVLGHESRGAVKATLEAVKAGKTTAPGQIGAVVGPIIPAVQEVLGKPGDELDNAVRAVVKRTVAALTSSPVLSELIAEKKVKVVGARYDLDTGKVELIG